MGEASPEKIQGPQPFPNTSPLVMEGDIASHLVRAADDFLLKKLADSIDKRETFWSRDTASPEAYVDSVRPNRERLAHLLGLRDTRHSSTALEYVVTTDRPSLRGRLDDCEIHAVRWRAFGDVTGEGLLLTPHDCEPTANVVALPDANLTPEQVSGLEPLENGSPYAWHLAASGCRVVVPTVISRAEAVNGITCREYVYRSAYELGRHLIAYEIHKVCAVVDWFQHTAPETPVGVLGWGDGGMLALYSAAVDERITASCVSGYFESKQEMWRGPIDRNVFGLLERFGDAEVASLIWPRSLVVEASPFPEARVPEGTGKGAPYDVTTPDPADVRTEFDRAVAFLSGIDGQTDFSFVTSDQYGAEAALSAFSTQLGFNYAAPSELPQPTDGHAESRDRMTCQVEELLRHNDQLLSRSAGDRDAWFQDLDCASVESFETSIGPYREAFARDVIGTFDDAILPCNPRTRLAYDGEGWKGYEVVLDVFDGLFAYGILAIPDGLEDGDRRPVVVCQHGLEGRPQKVVDGLRPAYNDFGTELCRHGFVVFAPQNLYIFTDRFRNLQRKANPLGQTLFSLIVPQHQQITEWLKTLPFVDSDRIAFYGISYGGKTAMRIPPLVENYCLSICSADFNEWIWKNASRGNRYTYLDKGEYEIFEWDLGSRFNYAEMARLICPRPFMVERGHDDGVAPDETVAYEFAKVKRFYDKLGIGDRTEMEVFNGGHEIHLKGTLEFLRKHLEWPEGQ